MNWPWAFVIAVCIAGVVTLAVMHADATYLMLVVVSVLGGAGATQLSAVQQNTNGNVSALLAELAKHREALTAAAGLSNATADPASTVRGMSIDLPRSADPPS